MLIIKPSVEEVRAGLESWDWLDFSGLTPIAASCFGDVFFDSGAAIFFLDVIAGEIKEVCKTRSDLQDILNSPEGQDEYLLGWLVDELTKGGMSLSQGECYDFKVSPILNGPIEPNNVSKMSFQASLNVAGQIHKQVKDLPVGTVIKSVKVAD